MMMFLQFVIYVLNDHYLKFRKVPSITSQEIANYISVALAVALSVVHQSSRRPCVNACIGACVKIFKHEYLRDQQADHSQILSEVSLG